MPFTPAHTAIVLPFIRMRPERISATALIIGSMAPDFEYFSKMTVSGQHGHTLWGVLYFDLPVTIALSFLFHLVIKDNLVSNFPAFLQIRFCEMIQFDFTGYFKKYYLQFLICAAIGALSHITWDAFTHGDGYFATRISLYKQIWIPFDGVRYPLFYALQQFSTFVGLAIVCTYILLLKPSGSYKPKRPTVYYWILIVAIYGVVMFLRFAFTEKQIDLGNFVVSSVTALVIGVSVGGLVRFGKGF
jgi:Domain of unknown function (DUF4184)